MLMKSIAVASILAMVVPAHAAVVDTTVGYANQPATNTQGVYLGVSKDLTNVYGATVRGGLQTVLDSHSGKMDSYGATVGIPIKFAPYNKFTLTPEIAVNRDRRLDKTLTEAGVDLGYKLDRTVSANVKVHRVLNDEYKGESYMFGVTKTW